MSLLIKRNGAKVQKGIEKTQSQSRRSSLFKAGSHKDLCACLMPGVVRNPKELMGHKTTTALQPN